MAALQKYDHVKIGILGEPGVGKTHILHQYLEKKLPENPASTIAVEFGTTIFQLRDGTKIKLELWDTAGSEKYRQILTVHMQNADGIVLVYDITSSFKEIEVLYVKIRKECPQIQNIMLLGNKIDLVKLDEKKRKVNKTLAEKFAVQNNLLFFEISAFDNQMVDWSMQQLVQQIIIKKSITSIQNQSKHTKQITNEYCQVCQLF